jgi:hypothetical protein
MASVRMRMVGTDAACHGVLQELVQLKQLIAEVALNLVGQRRRRVYWKRCSGVDTLELNMSRRDLGVVMVMVVSPWLLVQS